MCAFSQFYGNEPISETLVQMIEQQRIPQTILLSGPEGIGKATLARRFAAALLGDERRVEQDDLSLPANIDIIDQREKWTSEKRGDDPLLFSSHPDFVTFTPDGPLRQLTIQQMRTFRERAPFKPLRGRHRVFLIDRLDRANEQSANSVLKVLEEPPEHLVIIATAENLYDLLPTIRSRAVVFQMSRLSTAEMKQFVESRALPDAEARVALAEGSPGLAVMLDLSQFRERRDLVLTALNCSAGIVPFSEWLRKSESFSNRKTEKLELYLRLAYTILEDVLCVLADREIRRNADIRGTIETLASRVSFSWIAAATAAFDELVSMVRRNIQKTIAVDALVINLRNHVALERT